MTHIYALTSVRELAHRQADGIDVRLLWNGDSNTLSVVVLDSKTHDSFELVLDEHDRPLDVFDHPYAYAAHRGLEFPLPSRQPEYAVAA
jgi:YD repeat-containing protein